MMHVTTIQSWMLIALVFSGVYMVVCNVIRIIRARRAKLNRAVFCSAKRVK